MIESDKPNLTEEIFGVYWDYQIYLRETLPRSFFIRPEETFDSRPLMGEFVGDMNSSNEVEAYLLSRAPEEKRIELARDFRMIESIMDTIQKSSKQSP